MVTKSEGLMTRYGRTSIVSLKDVIDLAGRSLGFDFWAFVRKRPMIFSMWTLISGGVAADSFLREVSRYRLSEDYFIPSEVYNQSACPQCNLLEDSLAGIFCDVIFCHHAMGLQEMSAKET
jgi:hypothetical protein